MHIFYHAVVAHHIHICFQYAAPIIFHPNMWKDDALALLNGEEEPKEDSDDDTEDDSQPY